MLAATAIKKVIGFCCQILSMVWSAFEALTKQNCFLLFTRKEFVFELNNRH